MIDVSPSFSLSQCLRRSNKMYNVERRNAVALTKEEKQINCNDQQDIFPTRSINKVPENNLRRTRTVEASENLNSCASTN